MPNETTGAKAAAGSGPALNSQPLDQGLASIDAWVAEHQPSVRHELAQLEKEHLVRFTEEFGRGFEQFYVQYGALVDLVDDLNSVDKVAWPSHRSIQFVLLSKNLLSMHSAMDRLSRGAYSDALSLIRGAYDAALRLIHISCYRDQPYGALVRKPAKGVPQFNATGLVRDELRLGWIGKYGIMSVFAHANVFEAMESLRHAQEGPAVGEEPERFGLQFGYDDQRIELVFPLLQFVLLFYLRFAIERLAGSALLQHENCRTTALEAAAFIESQFRSHPKPYWGSTMDDLEYVFTLLGLADDGGDWRQLRDERPLIEPTSTAV